MWGTTPDDVEVLNSIERGESIMQWLLRFNDRDRTEEKKKLKEKRSKAKTEELKKGI